MNHCECDVGHMADCPAHGLDLPPMSDILTTKAQDPLSKAPEMTPTGRIIWLTRRQSELLSLAHPTDGFAQGSPEQEEWNRNAVELRRLRHDA